jgi:beta-lactamase regulating signal transducer with metallopeptidase domain
MTIELLFAMFLRAELAASLAILLILALRLPVRRLLGAELAYGLWLLAPATAMASLFAAFPEFAQPMANRHAAAGRLVDWDPVIGHARLLAPLWLIGAALVGLVFALAQLRFERAARAGRAGPAATGFWPRMITPYDYARRFTPEERAMIRAHERAHMDRRDPTTNLFIALVQAAGWFNPLMHLAARTVRLDQELAIDAKVIAQYPKGRRRYAEVLVKAHAHGFASPLACALAVGGRHPLEVRLALLGVRKISVRRDAVGVFAIGALGVALALLLWTLTPI